LRIEAFSAGTLGPSWWGGETEPAGDKDQTNLGNWDSPGAVDHCKLLADARQVIAEAERLSALDGEERCATVSFCVLTFLGGETIICQDGLGT